MKSSGCVLQFCQQSGELSPMSSAVFPEILLLRQRQYLFNAEANVLQLHGAGFHLRGYQFSASQEVFRILWISFNTITESDFTTGPVLSHVNLLKLTGHLMHQQFNIQQLYALPTLYLCVLYLSENKQRLVPLTA